MSHERAHGRRGIACIALLLGAAYAPALVRDYGFSDDYPAVAKRLRGVTAEARVMYSGGRPVLAVVADLAVSPIKSIRGLRYLRLLGIVGIVALACVLARSLADAGLERTEAMLASIAITTTPPFQVYAAWAVTAFYPFAALIAGRAFWLADAAVDTSDPGRRRAIAVTASLWLTLAVTLYQPAAAFFWVFAATRLLRLGAGSRSERRLLWYGSIFATALAAGYLTFRVSLIVLGEDDTDDRSRLAASVLDKALWFVQTPLTDALNLHNLFPSRGLALAVALLLATGLWRSAAPASRLPRLLLAVTLLPLAYLPNLVIAENWSSYRTQLALTSLLAVQIVFALGALFGPRPAGRRLFTAVLSAWALSGLASATVHVERYFAGPQSRELRALRELVREANLAHARSIVVIPAVEGRTLAPAVRYDEFGLMSATTVWAPSAQVFLLLREMYPEQSPPRIRTAAPGEEPHPPRAARVVDLRSLGRER